MFEHMTSEYLMERLLSQVSDDMDKREGSIIYDALAPCAIELSNAYMSMDMVLTESFADTASGFYLIKRAAERGMIPEPATYAHVKGAFYGAEIPVGKKFSCGNLNYQTVEKIENGEHSIKFYELVCLTSGSDANGNLGTLTPITSDDYVEGMDYAEIVEVTIPGKDEEDQESLRERYYSSFTNQAFGGNASDYKNKTKDIEGVGGVKVIPTWNGGGTVKLVIIDSEFSDPSEELISLVQDKIDPNQDAGGGGIAPIGHIVTVAGVKNKTINISTTVTCKQGTTFEDVKPYIFKAVDTYFRELSSLWDEQEKIIVRVSQIETRILAIDGVEDIMNTMLNNSPSNVMLGDYEIPVRGVVNG